LRDFQVHDAEPRGAATNARMVQKRQQKDAALKPANIKTDDWMPEEGTLPPVHESPKGRGESISGSLSRNALPVRPAAVGHPQIGSIGSRSGVGQPGLEVAGFNA
jgi:hypothetical protein